MDAAGQCGLGGAGSTLGSTAVGNGGGVVGAGGTVLTVCGRTMLAQRAVAPFGPATPQRGATCTGGLSSKVGESAADSGVGALAAAVTVAIETKQSARIKRVM